jgi:outer membrane protein insertion porin family
VLNRLLLLLALVLGVTTHTGVFAAPVPATGTVSRVLVTGNVRIEEPTLLAAIGLRAGGEISPAAVKRDLKAVYATGYFDDITVDLEETADGVLVTFHVVEKPAIQSVELEGNKKIDETDIREVLDVRAFTVLNDSEVRDNIVAIRELYLEKGYYLANVVPVITPVGNDQVTLTFDITENKKVIVQRVEITGNEHVPSSKITRFMQTKEGGIAPWLTSSGTFRADVLETDTYIIRQVFLEEGFVDVIVETPQVYLSPDKRYIFVSINVKEGEQYKIGEVNVAGDFVPDQGLTEEALMQIANGRKVFDIQSEQWRNATGAKPPILSIPSKGAALVKGETFKLTTLQMIVQNITDFYGDQGYAFANVVPMPRTNPETQVVDVTFQVNKGERMRVGYIDVTGNNPTFDKVVRRELLVNEWELYRAARIRASKARLERLGFFEEVSTNTPRGEEPDVLDLTIAVSEQPTGSFSLGMGFSSLEQFVFTANVSKNNFLGLGYIMSAAVNFSALRKQWNLRFYDPYFLDSRWTFKVDSYSVTRQYQLDEYQRGGSFAIGRYLDSHDDMRLELMYTFEDVGLTSLDAFRASLLGGDLFRNGFTSSMGVVFELDKRNNRIFPTKGIYTSISTELAGGFMLDDTDLLSLFGGDFNFTETKANLRFYQPLINDDDTLVFRINSTLGHMYSTDGRTIPFIHRYRAGGINSVRGYDWFTLGPTVRSVGWTPGLGGGGDDPVRADDIVIVGGTQTWVNNFEIEAAVVRAAGISAVAFFDAGNAFGDPWGSTQMSISGLRTSVGLGVRWRSPMGPLRFEWGLPINPTETERKSVFDFSIGSFF